MRNLVCHIVFDHYTKDSRVRRLVKTLKENDYIIFVVCLRDGKEKIYEAKENIKVIRIPLRKKRASMIRRLYEYFLFEIAAFILASIVFFRYRIRLFHINTLPDFPVFSCIIPNLFGAKVILDFHFKNLIKSSINRHDHLLISLPIIQSLSGLEKLSDWHLNINFLPDFSKVVRSNRCFYD